jgi:hypothetical protein
MSEVYRYVFSGGDSLFFLTGPRSSTGDSSGLPVPAPVKVFFQNPLFVQSMASTAGGGDSSSQHHFARHQQIVAKKGLLMLERQHGPAKVEVSKLTSAKGVCLGGEARLSNIFHHFTQQLF